MEQSTKQSKYIEESLHGANAEIDEVNKIVKQLYTSKSKNKSQDYKKTYRHSHSKKKTCTRCGKKGHLSHNCKCTQGKKSKVSNNQLIKLKIIHQMMKVMMKFICSV